MVVKRYAKRTEQGLSKIQERAFLYRSIDAVEGRHFYGRSFAGVLRHLDGEEWDPVRRAFSETGLNTKDPKCWAELLLLFATVHYKPGAPGRKKHAPSYDEKFAQDLLAVSQGKTIGKSELARNFLESSIAEEGVYRSLKGEKGVLSAIRRLEKRAKTDWLSFAKVVIDETALETEDD
jgi:hypothetical protein